MNPLSFVRDCPDASVELPVPYVGYYEDWIDAQGETVCVVLNVFCMTEASGLHFLRTFRGATSGEAFVELCDWICGEYNSPMSG